jgi:hypothetical protein
MKRLAWLVIVALVAGACAKKEESGTKEGSAWPAGLAVLFNPPNRMIKHDKKLKMWVENKTAEEYSFEWTAEGKCGVLQWNKDKPAEAIYIGGQNVTDCNEKLTLKVAGAGTIEKQFGVKVDGSSKFAELEVIPDPIPDSWVFINDYEKTLAGKEIKCVSKIGGKEREKPSVGLAVDEKKKRKKTQEEIDKEKAARDGAKETEVVDYYDDVQTNLLGAPFGDWNFEFAGCRFADAPEGDEGALAFSYDLPHDDDYCGYYENLSIGKDCETRGYDTSKFTHMTFIYKSGDDKEHMLYAEMINWERFAEFHQGRPESVGPYIAKAKWQRAEIPLPKFYKDTLDPATIKSVSFKIKREANYPDHGLILFDNVAFINKKGTE